MKREAKGTAQKGLYLETTRGEFFHPTDPLLWTVEGKLRRVPTATALIAAPLMGLVYVVFLPIAGIIALFAFLGFKMRTTLAPRHEGQGDAHTA